MKYNPLKYSLYLIIYFVVQAIYNFVNAEEYVGSSQCQSCHAEQFNAWQGSHHDMSMKHADENSVLGDFNSVIFEKENHFYQKGKEYWVKIKGADGKFNDYQIKYTFGYKPLQQYMVEFDDGRVQLIPFAWDSREKEKGGQRWFNLYPDYSENHQDFFWMNTGQNWNYMCADCHSTNVDKNFDLKTNTYNTTFSEVNVGCEACHGPASLHIEWTKNKQREDKGFDRDLSKQVSNWIAKEGKTTLFPESIHKTQQTLVCAQCHSRRTQISNNDHVKSKEYGERYMLSLITNDNYYADGQIYDEVFVYGSFLQSKMNDNGVVCSNCHDPHTAKLTIPEEAVCLQCHQAPTYANKSHHQHQENTAGAQCVNCHMPETTYMEVDDRRDHGWHKPNPELAMNFGTPDTCLTCHDDKTSEWSAKHVNQWFGNKSKESEPFAPVFAIADSGYQNMSAQLSKIAQSQQYVPIIRASALSRLENTPDRNALIAIARNVKHPNSHVRRGAIEGATNLNPAEKWRVLSPLLSDKVLSVRIEAAMALVPLWQQLSTEQKQSLRIALKEYMSVQDFNADRGYAHTNKAVVYSHQGLFDKAINAYLESMRIEPYFAAAYVNMAELYRQQGLNPKAIETLLKGADANPSDSTIPYSLGLAYIRAKQVQKAQESLKNAAHLAKTNGDYFYVYALSLEGDQPKEAEKQMAQAYKVSRNPQHLYALCEMQIKNKSFQVQQCLKALEKVAPANAVNALRNRL